MGLPLRRNRTEKPPAECPLSECMSMLRGAWSANVLWYLGAGPRRFGELRHDIPPISARVLSARLRELEGKGLVTRKVKPTSPPSVEYALTPLGQELIPALRAIVDVGHRLKQRPSRRAANSA